MGKRLVITEKPSVARDIVQALGGFSEHDDGEYWERDDMLVTFAVGHLFELPAPDDIDPKYKRWTLDTLPILPESFPLKAKSGTRDRVSVLKKLLKRDDVDGLVNACDAGREGELIFREITEFFDAKQPIERLWLQSMTKKAISEGFDRLQDGRRFDGLSDAAHCRNYTDWLIGMNATRALTRRLKTRSENAAWSAGRVQTPTLAMLVDREVEVLQHVPAPYWRVHADFSHSGSEYRGTWFDPNFKGSEDDGAKDDRIFDEARAQAIAARIEGQPAAARETRKPSNEAAPLLFDLTSLQREANRRFGWSARRTLNAAQRCYEAHKVLTYPRTDAKALPNDYRAVVDDVIDQLGADPRFSQASATLKAKGLLNEKKIFDDAKVTDHFAIVPTGTVVELSGDDARVFDLVTRRFLAAFFPPAIWSRVERVTEVAGEHFRSRARTLQVPGWREVLGDEADEKAPKLPPLIPGQDKAEGVSVSLEGQEVEADETKPPPRISESRLLSLMENAGRYVEDDEAAEAMKDSGIGTPATRADIIENLIVKGYAQRVGRALKPSVKGIRLIDILRRMNNERLASPALTGELEAHLGRVERGDSTRDAFMEEVYTYAKEIVDLTKSFEFEDLYPNEASLGTCPCGKKKNVYERSWFYRCEEPEGLDWQTIKAKKKAGEEVPEDCDFRVWKDKSGRYIDRRTVTELLENKRSRVLDGFVARNGRTFKGILELGDDGVELRPVEGASSEESVAEIPEYEVNEEPLRICPVCGRGHIIETRSTFVCTEGLKVL
ncbi:MAG: DNA topoisomerase 3, partial [Myxococcota bacterium]